MIGERSLLNETKRKIRAIGLRPSKRLGQHFAVSPALIERMVREADLGHSDKVLEIGGGTGTLTERLAKEPLEKLIVVERDRRLASLLMSKFSNDPRICVTEGDYLRTSLPSYDKCVSNPPFSISSKIVLKLIDESPRLVITTFQRDYAERLTSNVGERRYGRLTVLLHLNYSMQELAVFPNSAFFPPPSTEISLLKMVLKPDRISKADARALQVVTNELFKYRRKRLAKAIKMSSLPRVLFDHFQVAAMLDKRVFELSPSDFLSMAKLIVKSDS